MKILFVDQTAKLGGGELALLEIVKHYRTESKVILFEDGPLVSELQQRDVPVGIIKSAQSISCIRRSSRIPLTSVAAMVKMARDLAVEAKNFDCIFANSQKAGLLSVLASHLSKKPVIWYLHDILTSEHFGRAQLFAAKYTARRSNQILVNSEATRDSLIALTSREKDVHLVYNAFDTATYGRSSEAENANTRRQLGFDKRPLVGLFGRLAPWKGQDVFLRALAQMPMVQGMIVGSPLFGEDTYAERLRRDVHDLGLGERVKFLDFQKDIPSLMGACDVVAHTSIAPEPFGRVVVEGMLAGKPVVASQTGGPNEIIEHGVTGVLYAPGDVQALSHSVMSVIDNPEAAATMGRCGRESALRRFSLEGMYTRLDEVIQVPLQTVGHPILSTSP